MGEVIVEAGMVVAVVGGESVVEKGGNPRSVNHKYPQAK